jgi:hypothetical protein
MRASQSIKPIGFSYDFLRDGGAVGVFNSGINVLLNRIYLAGLVVTVTGLTGGAATTLSFGTPSNPFAFDANVPIAFFSPYGPGANFNGFIATLTEPIIMTIENEPLISGKFSCQLIFFEMQGL